MDYANILRSQLLSQTNIEFLTSMIFKNFKIGQQAIQKCVSIIIANLNRYLDNIETYPQNNDQLIEAIDFLNKKCIEDFTAYLRTKYPSKNILRANITAQPVSQPINYQPVQPIPQPVQSIPQPVQPVPQPVPMTLPKQPIQTSPINDDFVIITEEEKNRLLEKHKIKKQSNKDSDDSSNDPNKISNEFLSYLTNPMVLQMFNMMITQLNQSANPPKQTQVAYDAILDTDQVQKLMAKPQVQSITAPPPTKEEVVSAKPLTKPLTKTIAKPVETAKVSSQSVEIKPQTKEVEKVQTKPQTKEIEKVQTKSVENKTQIKPKDINSSRPQNKSQPESKSKSQSESKNKPPQLSQLKAKNRYQLKSQLRGQSKTDTKSQSKTQTKTASKVPIQSVIEEESEEEPNESNEPIEPENSDEIEEPIEEPVEEPTELNDEPIDEEPVEEEATNNYIDDSEQIEDNEPTEDPVESDEIVSGIETLDLSNGLTKDQLPIVEQTITNLVEVKNKFLAEHNMEMVERIDEEKQKIIEAVYAYKKQCELEAKENESKVKGMTLSKTKSKDADNVEYLNLEFDPTNDYNDLKNIVIKFSDENKITDISLVSYFLPFNNNNVTRFNNKFMVYFNNRVNKIMIPPGKYEINSLLEYIKNQITFLEFSINENKIVTIKNTMNMKFDLMIDPDSIFVLLGFTGKLDTYKDKLFYSGSVPYNITSNEKVYFSLSGSTMEPLLMEFGKEIQLNKSLKKSRAGISIRQMTLSFNNELGQCYDFIMPFKTFFKITYV
jgi:hypothetical protein